MRDELKALFDKDICKFSMHACFDGVVGNHSSSNDDDFSKFNDLFQYVPSSQGWRNAMHYAQLIANDGEFRRYDHFSFAANVKAYGLLPMLQTLGRYPPRYATERLTAPLAILSGEVDHLADRIDVQWLQKQLKHRGTFDWNAGKWAPQLRYFEEYPGFGHLTFAIGKEPQMREVFGEKIPMLFRTFAGKALQPTETTDFSAQETVGVETSTILA